MGYGGVWDAVDKRIKIKIRTCLTWDWFWLLYHLAPVIFLQLLTCDSLVLSWGARKEPTTTVLQLAALADTQGHKACQWRTAAGQPVASGYALDIPRDGEDQPVERNTERNRGVIRLRNHARDCKGRFLISNTNTVFDLLKPANARGSMVKGDVYRLIMKLCGWGFSCASPRCHSYAG